MEPRAPGAPGAPGGPGPRLLERGWEPAGGGGAAGAGAGAGPGPGPGAGGLRVLQWNCLADGLAQRGGFARCPPGALEWGPRRVGLEAELGRAGADLIGLQEVNHFDWLRGFLAGRGYDSTFLPKSRSPCLALGFPADGLVLAWREARFELVELRSEPYEGFGQGSSIVSLRERGSGRPLVFGTTHLKAKPEGAEAREQQAHQLAARLAEAAAAAGTGDVIVTGDFNEGPGGQVLRVLEGGAVCGLADACRGWAANGDAAGAPFTTWKWRSAPPGGASGEGGPDVEKRAWIDFVLAAGAPRPRARLALPRAAAVGPAGLPCPAYPSDHLALVLEFAW